MTERKKHAETPVLMELQRLLRSKMNDYADDMIAGSCKNFPEYTHMTGKIEGLALAERELLDLDDNLIQAD